MKKILLLLLVAILAVSLNAQTNDHENYYKGIESNQELRLSSEQIAKIKKLKREIGPQFAAINKDRNLSGYEKGERKRALAQKHRAEIRSILSENQITILDKKYGVNSDGSLKDVISDKYDSRLDALERKYEADIDALEGNNSLSKSEIKARKKALKDAYKAEKDKLKAEKESAKRATIL
ncbi:hypothetical protein [Prevotella sp. 10(H)]|uniref:hypothetical protein n=1 Tax=Prevotella sp. 10(H) TaxID=1158294 RepID=UPI0004A717F9|nr:hypothetical protein [Prevotella sp. 10(H)]